MEAPFIPAWTMNQSGMVGLTAPLEVSQKAEALWLETRDLIVKQVEKFEELKIHKQNVNRLLEPFFYAKVVCSATDLDWFYWLRDSGTAQEEIAILARAMKEAQRLSTPTVLKRGEWHIPYILPEEAELSLEQKLKISVARCARVSYKCHDNDLLSTFEKDLKLFEQLYEDKHYSPFEHQAKPKKKKYKKSNFRGWKQYRQVLVG